MALLERVATLIRANLNDMVDRAEDPEKMIKQVILDMQNQLLQVKTQVAIAIADEHLLQKKQKENLEKHDEWMKKAAGKMTHNRTSALWHDASSSWSRCRVFDTKRQRKNLLRTYHTLTVCLSAVSIDKMAIWYVSCS